jgi:hypothetical protein
MVQPLYLVLSLDPHPHDDETPPVCRTTLRGANGWTFTSIFDLQDGAAA